MDLSDSESTETPASLTSSTNSVVQGAPAETPISFSDCQDLARTVVECSKSLIEGSWVNITHSRGSKKRFIPGNFESAKEFLRASVEGI